MSATFIEGGDDQGFDLTQAAAPWQFVPEDENVTCFLREGSKNIVRSETADFTRNLHPIFKAVHEVTIRQIEGLPLCSEDLGRICCFQKPCFNRSPRRGLSVGQIQDEHLEARSNKRCHTSTHPDFDIVRMGADAEDSFLLFCAHGL